MNERERKNDILQRSSYNSLPHPSDVSKLPLQTIPYPKSVFFIIGNEFCERFSHYGTKAILSCYLTDMLLFSQSDAKIIFHTFIILACFFVLFGAMFGDSLLGNFRTILYASIIYAIGCIVLVLAATPILHLPHAALSLLALGLMAIGIGSSKPSAAAFGADQFILPEQEKQLTVYFSLYFFANNFGSCTSTLATPLLREQHCFGNQCFTLAFGVAGILMIASLVFFALGWSVYKIRKPEGNVVIKVGKCIGYAIKEKWISREKKQHWLDFAEERYGEQLVNEIKATLSILLLYIPLPLFWALFDQQGTSWTFMARNMNGDIGFYTIPPDQMQMINPFLVLVFIPLFNYAIYPMLENMNWLKTPLQRLGCGGVLMAVAFFISASVSMMIEAENPVLPKGGEGQLIIYNNNECDLKFAYKLATHIYSAPDDLYKGAFKILDFKFEKSKILEYKLFNETKDISTPLKVELIEEKSIGLLLNGDKNFEDGRKKYFNGFPSLRVVVNKKLNDLHQVVLESNSEVVKINTNDSSKQHSIPSPNNYTVKLDGKVLGEHNFRLGAVYTAIFNIDENDIAKTKMYVFEVTGHNTIHMLWIIPQYVLLTMAQIMFAITGLEFSYSQAPASMKSALQACWLLNSAFGNLLVVIIESAKIFEEQSLNFILYAGLMLIDMFIFALIAMRYNYVQNCEEDADKHDDIS